MSWFTQRVQRAHAVEIILLPRKQLYILSHHSSRPAWSTSKAKWHGRVAEKCLGGVHALQCRFKVYPPPSQTILFCKYCSARFWEDKAFSCLSTSYHLKPSPGCCDSITLDNSPGAGCGSCFAGGQAGGSHKFQLDTFHDGLYLFESFCQLCGSMLSPWVVDSSVHSQKIARSKDGKPP